jgi:hypothetical protein
VYVRNQGAGRRVRPPDNYSGNAFDREGYRMAHDLPLPQELLPSDGDSPPEGEGMPLPDLGGSVENTCAESFGASECKPTVECVCDEKKDSAKGDGGGLRRLLSSIMPPRPESEKCEFGFEDMLIIGLIFLLSQSEGDEDVLLLLTLLLFYK